MKCNWQKTFYFYSQKFWNLFFFFISRYYLFITVPDYGIVQALSCVPLFLEERYDKDWCAGVDSLLSSKFPCFNSGLNRLNGYVFVHFLSYLSILFLAKIEGTSTGRSFYFNASKK